jgi:RND family efflux transporter MFP subunit
MVFLKNKWVWMMLLVVLGGYYWYSKNKTPQDMFVTTSVVRGTVSQTVSASASLVSDASIALNFETTGRIKGINTKVGALVSEGDALASIESTTLDNEVRKAQATLDTAWANAGINDDAINDTRSAQKNAKKYADEVSDAEDQKVSATDKAYANAVNYMDDVKNYYNQVVSDHGAGSTEAKSAKISLTSAENAKQSAQENKDTARHNRSVSVQIAQNALDAQKDKVKSLVSKSQKVLENSAIAIAQANYDIAVNNRNKAILIAPVNGMITKISYKRGEVIGSASEQSFGRLLSKDLILEAKIPESDIAFITLDKTASVSFDALPSDTRLDATVVEIDPESTLIQDVVYYKVKLRLAAIDKRLKAGMSADADIHIAEKQQTLFVPNRALKQDGTVHFVEMKSRDGLTAERREVKVGLSGSDGQTEILSGINEGDEVITEKKK